MVEYHGRVSSSSARFPRSHRQRVSNVPRRSSNSNNNNDDDKNNKNDKNGIYLMEESMLEAVWLIDNGTCFVTELMILVMKYLFDYHVRYIATKLRAKYRGESSGVRNVPSGRAWHDETSQRDPLYREGGKKENGKPRVESVVSLSREAATTSSRSLDEGPRKPDFTPLFSPVLSPRCLVARYTTHTRERLVRADSTFSFCGYCWVLPSSHVSLSFYLSLSLFEEQRC